MLSQAAAQIDFNGAAHRIERKAVGTEIEGVFNLLANRIEPEKRVGKYAYRHGRKPSEGSYQAKKAT